MATRQYVPSTDRALPADEQAEASTLGAVLLNREALITIAPWLEPEHFYNPSYALIYTAMLACLKRGTPPDLTTVSSELRRAGDLETVGGMLALIELMNATPTAVHVEYYAQSIERHAIDRRLIQAGTRIAQLGYTGSIEEADKENAARKELDGALTRKSDAAVQPIASLSDRAFARLNNRTPPGTPTRFTDLDLAIGGFPRKELTVIAGRPAMGKTALMLSLVYRIARAGGKVLVFSIEMPGDALFDRLACIHAELDYQQDIQHGRVYDDPATKARYTEAIGYLNDLAIFIDDSSPISTTEMHRRALLQTNRSGEMDAIFVDYLQLLRIPGTRPGDEYARTTEASAAVTSMAKLCRAPVIALSQLSRETEKRKDPTPSLSDLRGSGQIEQDASLVLFPFRPEMYDTDDVSKKGLAELHIAKNRNGRTGMVPLHFNGPSMRFDDLTPEWEQPDGY